MAAEANGRELEQPQEGESPEEIAARELEADLASLSEELPAGHRSGFVALAGRPNVGKSTLLNRLIGDKVAIVSSKPQTTRDRLLGILTRPDAQVIFVDLPGLHKPRHLLGKYMMEQASEALADADVILFMVEAFLRPTEEDQLAAEFLRQNEKAGRPVVLVLNKVDQLAPEQVDERLAAYQALGPFRDTLLISALNGRGCQELLERVLALLPVGPRYYPLDQISDQQDRSIAAELIREQVLAHTFQEVPHGVAVVVEQFKERPDGKTYIEATIYVERESHKGIVIGQKGQMLKIIGQEARQTIERLLEGPVYLELWVKVRKDWRKKEEELLRLGYRPPRGKKRGG
jgi:GTPase